MRLFVLLFIMFVTTSSALLRNQWGRSIALNARMSSQSEGKTLFTSYTVYKGKAALSIKPIAPTFQAVGNNQKLAREGSLLLEFAPAGGNGMATNQREYDWSKKQFFALNLAEMGDLISFDKTKGFELFHDPNLGGK
jgi:hypothetical protein